MSTPTVNVNLNAYCDAGIHCRHDRGHSPIPIPCPIPRTVIFEVRLGECRCDDKLPIPKAAPFTPIHFDDCLARPIRVTCTIGGDGTWAGSEVTDCAARVRRPAPYEMSLAAALAVCRERWALVKALVLGTKQHHHSSKVDGRCNDLACERDAVFAALAAKARAEQIDDETTRALIKAVPGLRFPDMAKCTAEDYLSARALLAYVKHLITEIGAMP